MTSFIEAIANRHRTLVGVTLSPNQLKVKADTRFEEAEAFPWWVELWEAGIVVLRTDNAESVDTDSQLSDFVCLMEFRNIFEKLALVFDSRTHFRGSSAVLSL
jgi:hypothetical protein